MISKHTSNLRNMLQKPALMPVALFLVCLLAYGLYIPWMGFYWDDWPWIWQFHVYGPQAIREIDAAFRPLAGVVLWLGTRLAGTDATRWQLYNLIIRWLGGWSLWWALRQVWPKRQNAITWAAILFLVYTGFGQQFVSINSSRHLLPLITFTLSIGFTARAFQRGQPTVSLTVIAVTLSLLTMFTTEYYYGLEIARLGILWLLVSPSSYNASRKIGATLRAWIPYLLPLVSVFAWRFATSQQVNYQVVLVDQLAASPWRTLWMVVSTALGDFWETTLGVWRRLFIFPSPSEFGPRKTALYWAIVLIGLLGTYVYTQLQEREPAGRTWNFQAIGLGALCLLVSGLPFWSTGLEVKLAFPNDRLTLPMMLGASLLAVGLLDLLKPPAVKNLALAMIAGLSFGAHFKNATSYQRDWETQAAFFQQLNWRIPALEPGTTILTPELPILYSTDNSLTAPLNWIYAAGTPVSNLPYGLFYLDLRLGSKITALEPGELITMGYGPISFQSTTSQAVVVYYDPPACLRVMQPVYDENQPGTPELLDLALPLSNPSLIRVEATSPAVLPETIYQDLPAPGEQWCYHYQKADLARQAGDWQQVAEIGDLAFQLDDSPNRASERVPFIEAYAHRGDWDRAADLTLEAIEINKLLSPMLCDTWNRILRDLPISEGREAAVLKIEQWLGCGLLP